MSGPFRFHEEARSPLDRSASPFSAGQPVSFKTNINRAKTKKWVQAKKNAYDGDDWGDYDEYDEYGVNQEPQQEKPAAQRYYAQRTEQPSRSFTDPSQQAPPLRARKNSFDQGEEQRAFSSTISHSQPVHGHPHGDSREQPYGYDTGGVGDFSPSAVPPPLQPRISQVPANFTPPSNNQFPPRKSSIGQGDLPIVNPPRPRNGSGSDKPLPIVRPADIYKRHQEENERASSESARPNIDSIASQAQEGGKPLQPMETVAERKSEHLPDSNATAAQNESQSSHQELPTLSPSDDDDLRSVVNQAFTRVDDSRSVPPTPTSNDTSSDLLRSNTGSTAGISPIMSRVPSSAASALKNRNQAEGSTPVITEEPAEASTPVAQPTSENNVEPLHHVPRKPSPAHSRNISSSSTPRSGLATPTRGDSPARSPVLAPSRDIPEPKSALFSTEDDASPEAMEGGLKGPSLEYATREADLATSNNSRPNSGVFDLGAAQRQSQNMFLESHNAQSPIDDVISRDRSESPSKGRVQALAGKFGEVSSRRGSTQSNRSRNSVQSWEQSQNNSRAASPTKGSPSKPSSPVKEFRPHLPGQWESYTTTVMTPSEHGEQERGLSTANDNKTSLEKSDLTPTTAKQSVAEVPPTEADNADPMIALKNAGAAMVESIRTTIGIDEKPTEGQQDQKQPAERGDVYLPRPLQLDRTITSDSSAPPTPPAKDTPQPEVSPSPSEEKSPQTVEEDEESDRLRKEIVASLSPFKAPESPTGESNLTPLQPGSPGTNRASSIFPSEYKTYWAEEDRASRRSSQASEHKTQEQPPTATVAFLPQSEDPTKPVIKRFSWEANSSHLPTPDGETKEVSVTEPPKTAEEPKEESPLPVELPAEPERQQQPESLSASSLGPIHTLTVTKPDPITDPEKPVEPSPPLDLTRPTTSPTLERTHSPGLHVVNTEIDPEAVDLPPRFSADNEPPPPAPEEPKLIEKAATPEPTETHPAMEPRTEEPSISATAQEPSSKAPVTDKPLGAREIATLNSPVERIDTYNKTRDYWAKVDHGLSDWLTAALDANPDLATQTYPVQRVPTQSVRHRHTGSLLFGKLGGSSSHDLPAEQNNDAPVPVPASTSSPTAGPSSGSGFGGRLANQHMQLKGKDLLHTANVLGGKGMTSAKGLFAKGKSRFGREKASSRPPTDSAPSSREVSEEPETVTRRSRAEGRWNAALMSLATERGKGKGAPNEEKQKTKKRFSFASQLRRVSRSRSRSNSVALPNETVSPGDHQPYTFYAPDTWSSHSGMRPMGLNEYFNTTPSRQQVSQPRLGVLPSPVKSTSSGQGKDTERHVPPVPPIPDGVAIKHYRRRSSQDNASHQMLQSVIRHSSRPTAHNRHSMPPMITKEKQVFIEDPVFNDDMQPGALERAEDYKALMRVPKGAFQPDLPTTESENRYKHGFQFGFTDDVLPKAKDNHDDADYGDDDDQPPKLNHDPVPAPMPSERQSVITDVYMDVSDEDNSDDGLFRGRNMAKLRAESTTRPKAETSLNGLEGADEQVTYHNAALMVGLRRFGHDGNAILTVQTQPRSSTEAEVLVADDVSYISHPSPDHKGDDTAVRPDQAAAERALSPVWFTKKDLELPMRNSAPKETETLPTQCTASPDLVQDPDSTAIGEIRTAGQPPAATRTDGEISLRPDLAGVEADTSQVRQVSALPTHAAQGKISSSAASWHLRETVTLPLFDAHTLGDMSETSSVVTPVAHVPRILRSEPETPKAGPWHDDGSHGAVPDVQAHVHDNFPDLKPQALQLQASHATMAGPVRSKSILSQISAMVSEENKTPYSHASYGRSTPSAALRMRPEFSKRLPPAPVHISEETPASHDDRAANGEDDDFDLYADHNGIVKDVCDENGQPLRVAEAQESAQVPQHQLVIPLAPDVAPARASQDEEPPRYSTERPMSFIAGPADQDGKPQDQINQESYRPRRLETIYSELPTNSPDPSLDQSQPSSASISPPPSSPPPKNILRAVRSIDPTRPAKQALLDQTHSSEEANSQGYLPAEANTHDQLPQNGHVTNQALHQPQPQRAQPILQGIFRGQSPSPVPQVQIPEQGPRNQYELRQQMLQQASNARLQGVQKHPSVSPEPPSADEASKPHEKSSTKTTVSSMFKKFGGKTHVHLHHTIPPTPPFDPRFSGESSPAAPSNRSKVEQKHHSVQTAPDLHLKKPESPGIFHRVTLQQPRSATSIKSMPYDMLHPDAQPGPKKKRFSHLGAFFHKGGAGGDSVAAKLKPSKDDKKAQKAHQNSSAASTESQVWHWDTQKQRYINKKTDQTSNSSDKPQQNDGQGQNQESMQGTRSNEGSAFLSTKQLAEEHQAQQSSQQALQANNNSYTTPLAQGTSVPFDRLQQRNQDTPIAEYYKPITDQFEDQRGAYAATTAAIQWREQQKQLLRQGPDSQVVPQAQHLQAHRQNDQSAYGQSNHRNSRYEQEQGREPSSRPQSELIFNQAWLGQREQMEQEREQSVHRRHGQPSSNGHGMPQQIPHHHQPLPLHLKIGNQHPLSNPPIAPGQGYHYNPQDVLVSPAEPSGPSEPKYEPTPIPAAYNHVSGAFVSSLDQPQQPVYPPQGGQATYALPNRAGWQYGDPGMPVLTPQVSVQSAMHPYHRTYSDASVVSMMTPVQDPFTAHNSSPHPSMPRAHRPRMSSISEAQQHQQQQQQGRPWHLNFPAGATDQEIVRARQGQYMQELFNAQQQQQAERAAGSPSPRMAPQHVTPIVTALPNHAPGGGFREIMPTNPSHPYAPQHPALMHQEEHFTAHRDPHDRSAAAPPHPAAYPQHISHEPTGDPAATSFSPVPQPPPKVPFSPIGHPLQDAQMNPINGQHHLRSHSVDHPYGAPNDRMSHHEEQVPEEAPPSYEGIGIPNDGMDKSRPEAVRPPNINTDVNGHDPDQRPGVRQRQSSIGMLQHPQPASMAASPQRTFSDMGAESLRLQLLQQENLVKMERIQREQERREALMRERQEREAARARARELERSVSAGGQVGSLRSAGGSGGWDRGNSYNNSHSRAVFELPAVVDDEDSPVMKATSYPGQEWVPSVWEGD